MPWCPKCKAEYREGFTECATCHVPLVDELPDEQDMEQMPDAVRQKWRDSGFSLRVSTATKAAWEANEQQISVTDAGFTEVNGPTETVRASW